MGERRGGRERRGGEERRGVKEGREKGKEERERGRWIRVCRTVTVVFSGCWDDGFFLLSSFSLYFLKFSTKNMHYFYNRQ